MKRLFFGSLFAIVATSSFAGDQPVTIVPVAIDDSGVVYFADAQNPDTPIFIEAVADSSGTIGTGTGGAPSTPSGIDSVLPIAVAMNGADRNALHQKLLDEAQRRGLR